MSEADVNRLMRQFEAMSTKFETMGDKLNDISFDVGLIKQRIENYPSFVDKVDAVDKKIDMQKQKCEAVQAGKTKINWSAVLTSIVTSLILMVVTFFVTKQIFGG